MKLVHLYDLQDRDFNVLCGDYSESREGTVDGLLVTCVRCIDLEIERCNRMLHAAQVAMRKLEKTRKP